MQIDSLFCYHSDKLPPFDSFGRARAFVNRQATAWMCDGSWWHCTRVVLKVSTKIQYFTQSIYKPSHHRATSQQHQRRQYYHGSSATDTERQKLFFLISNLR